MQLKEAIQSDSKRKKFLKYVTGKHFENIALKVKKQKTGCEAYHCCSYSFGHNTKQFRVNIFSAYLFFC